MIDFYIEALREKWQKIDYVFCGFGGASYFPNTMHLSGKDDFEIGIVREQLFAHNFCRVIKGLKPKIAVPFAADFALLADDQRWINDARFPRHKMADYYRQNFAESDYEPQIIDMYSGDVLENGALEPLSPYRKELKNGELGHLIDVQYADEIVEKRAAKIISEADAESLVEAVRQNVEHRKTLFNAEQLKRLKFCLELTDVAENRFIHIDFTGGDLKIRRGAEADEDVLLTMILTSEVLRYSIGSDWGADVISIGYGAEIDISSKKAAEVDLESLCMNLLACYPTFSDLKKTPFRTLKFLLLNPPRFTTSIRKLKKFNHESENYDRKTWLLKDASEIRRRYKLPELDAEFLPQN